MTTLTAVFVRLCIEAIYKSIELLAALLCMQENMSSGDDATTVQWVVVMEFQVADNDSLQRQERSAWKKHSIYQLPHGFVLDEKRLQAYKPKVVSLGPYHHGEEQVEAMEVHKRRALRHILVRTDKSLRDYRKALRNGGVLQLLMDSYKDLDKARWDDEERFLEMMILDGCFMMEEMKLHTGKISRPAQEYDANDPIFSYQGMLSNLPRIKRDMLMIENQIPLLVLHKLNAVEKGRIHEQDKEWVNNMVLEFFKQKTTETSSTAMPPTPPPTTEQENSSVPPAAGNDDIDVQEYMSMGLHVLDVVRKSMIKDKQPKAGHRGRSGGSISSGFDVIWPAAQLQEAGIKFQSPSLTDITFEERFLGLPATLSLPKLVVDDTTESKFLNLMAFEHLHMGSGKEVSSYVCFMDSIIDSDKDVSLLSQNNIIKNFVGTDQAVPDLFNGICHDVSMDPTSNLNKVHRQVTKYCNKPCTKHCANLNHAYFNTPWSIIAVVAATVALVITIIQFVYTLLSYYNHDA